ncbi:DUF6461 domain-containing protein [Sphaerisporangium album]|uniref:DUF6461 domain-containing protein n=1 Tax=Sphaerisporangium album TaxID=509200 RepID=UPI0015F0888A|nr:DUF6461 domain-containing protein [Sphaerisporangium album]
MLADIETHYRDLIERSHSIGELCMTWCQATSGDQVIQALDVDVLDVTMSDLEDLVDESYEDLVEGTVGSFLMLAEEPPWFLAIELSGDRAFGALERLSADGEAVCLIGSETLYRFRLYYAREGRLVCRFSYGEDIWGDTAPIEKHLIGLCHLHERYADVQEGRIPGEGLLEDWRIHAFILMERISGVRVSFELLGRKHALHRLRG